MGNSVISALSSTVNISVQTDAAPNGGAFTAFPSQACNAIALDNTSRQAIDYQRDGAGAFITLPAGSKRLLLGITNASQIGVRRSDYAVAGNTRRTTIVAQALVGDTQFTSVSATSQAITSGGGWALFPAAACVCMELINTSGKAIEYRLHGGGSEFKVRHNDSVMIYGITNANQVGIQAADSIVGFLRAVQAEVFQASLGETLFDFRSAVLVSDESRSEFDGLYYPQTFPAGFIVTPAMQGRTRMFKRGKRPLAQFLTAGTVVCTQPAQLADSATGQFMFGQRAVEYTQVNTSLCQFGPAAVLGTGQDVTGGHIHITFAFPSGTPNYFTSGAFTTLKVRLYSTGTPSSPSGNYHEHSLSTTFRDTYIAQTVSGAAGNGIRIYSMAIPLADFTAVGAGSTLTGIIYAAFWLQGGSAGNGAKFRPFEISYVPSPSKAAVVFTFDDIHIGQYINAAPILAKYGYPAVLCIDTIRKFPASGNASMSVEDALSLQNNLGWQLSYQVTDIETAVDTSPAEWLVTASKGVRALQALGASDAQDASYGSQTVTNISDERINAAARLFRSLMTFKTGTNATPPLQYGELLPFGDPYLIKRMNMSSGFPAGTRYDHWKDHVDQAVANKGAAIFAAHTEFNAGSSPEYLTALDSLCAYIRTLENAGTCEVHTLGSLIRSVYV